MLRLPLRGPSPETLGGSVEFHPFSTWLSAAPGPRRRSWGWASGLSRPSAFQTVPCGEVAPGSRSGVCQGRAPTLLRVLSDGTGLCFEKGFRGSEQFEKHMLFRRNCFFPRPSVLEALGAFRCGGVPRRRAAGPPGRAGATAGTRDCDCVVTRPTPKGGSAAVGCAGGEAAVGAPVRPPDPWCTEPESRGVGRAAVQGRRSRTGRQRAAGG